MTAYVVTYGADAETPIPATTNKPGRAIKVGSEPNAVAIKP